MAGMRQDWLSSSCSMAGSAELFWLMLSDDEVSNAAVWTLLEPAGLM